MDRITAKHAFALAMVALFVALGGTAAALDGSNTVFSDDITNGEVKSPDIRNGGVKAPDVGDNAIGVPESALLAEDQIVDGSVDGQDVNEARLDLDVQRVVNESQDDSSSFKTQRAECPPGERVIGTGGEVLGVGIGTYPDVQTEVAILEIAPFQAEVDVAAGEIRGGTDADWKLRAIAICARIAG
jgi:hypothetical protein